MVVVGFLFMVVAEWLSFLFNVGGGFLFIVMAGFFVYDNGWIFVLMVVVGFLFMVVVGFFVYSGGWVFSLFRILAQQLFHLYQSISY